MCDPPCDNGACIANDTCKCAEGYTGKTCSEIGRSQIVDLIFVLLDSYMYTPTMLSQINAMCAGQLYVIIVISIVSYVA